MSHADAALTPRARLRLAQLIADERTLPAWFGTALALQAGGVGVLQFVTQVEARGVIGLGLPTLGAVTGLVGPRRHGRADRAPPTGERAPPVWHRTSRGPCPRNVRAFPLQIRHDRAGATEPPGEPGVPILFCAPGRIRTCDTRFRKPLLSPLSYEGGDGDSIVRR